MNFKGTDCVIHVPQRLAGMDERVDNSCKRRAEYLRRSLIIVYTERGQWQASFIREKSVCLAVSVTEHILRKSPNSQKSWENRACANSVYQALFSPPTHKSLGTRLVYRVFNRQAFGTMCIRPYNCEVCNLRNPE